MSVPDPSHRQQDLLASFGRCRVLVIGDFIYDRFTHGSVDRISPEAPIPVFRVRHNHEMLGGAGNVALNIVAAGGKAILLSVIGDDPIADKSRQLTAELIGPDSILISESKRQTSIKQRYIASNQQLLRADTETTLPISVASQQNLLAAFDAAIKTCQAVLISDYAKGVLTDDVLSAVIARARKAGIPVLVDPKRTDFRAYSGATLVKPNKKEISEAIGRAVESDADVITAGKELLKLAKLDHLLITRGKDGLTVLDKNNVIHIPAMTREVWDVSGAGDTVIALMALGMAAGGSLEDSASIANIGAGIVVSKAGTATVSALELSRAIDAADHTIKTDHDLQNVVALDQAVEQVSRWRRLGLKIGFTNGVFDLMHPGHLSSLRMAKAECDRLVVGVNNDDSVRRLKGPERPIQDEVHRAAVLAALGPVDLVIIFNDDTPQKIIEAILPDVLVKGGDYNPDTIVGSDIVRAHGGRVVITPILEGFSTTNIVNKRGISRTNLERK
jgi:D-beta-D-heptose 7-phosphate kinase/D-beta-D-heptose 1-phosphate adenosyltransferase